LTVGQAATSRFVIDPTKDSLTRTSGPVTDRLALATLGLYGELTGGKTWRGLAPYIGVEAGVAIANKVASDTSTYNFGTKAVFGPSAGLRWFIGRRLSLRGD